MDRQEQYKRAIKTFTYLDHSLDEKSLLLGMNWADEFPEFKEKYFVISFVELKCFPLILQF